MRREHWSRGGAVCLSLLVIDPSKSRFSCYPSTKMYRRSSLHPRASTFSAATSSASGGNYLATIQTCVGHTESCIELVRVVRTLWEASAYCRRQLEDTVAELQSGTQDMERLSKVLHNSRVRGFLLPAHSEQVCWTCVVSDVCIDRWNHFASSSK